MKRMRRYDIAVLLGFLILFCCGISLLHGGADTVSDKNMLVILGPLIAARDSKKIALTLHDLPFAQAKQLLAHIISDKNNALIGSEKLDLLLSFVNQTADSNEQESALQILENNPSLTQPIPLLYAAVAGKYTAAFAAARKWFEKNNKLQEKLYEALYYAVVKNKPDIFNALIAKEKISAQEATKLAWEAVLGKKDPAFIVALAQQNADLNNARKGKTLLIAAVEHDDKALVGALLQQGAHVNLIADPAVGSPLQVAIRKGYSEVDQLLRSKGAKE